jgi:hypothetical protein
MVLQPKRSRRYEDNEPSATFSEHFPSISPRELEKLRGVSPDSTETVPPRLDDCDIADRLRLSRSRIAEVAPQPYRLLFVIGAFAFAIGLLLRSGGWSG